LNEGENATRTIRNLRSTLPADTEIIVVDDGSTDGSTDFRFADPRVHLVRTDGLGVAGARNHGAALATGEVLIFADAHIAVPAGWWRRLVKTAQEPCIGAVAPAVCDSSRPGIKGFGLRFADAALHIEWLRRMPRGVHTAPILPGCCLAMRRAVFEAVGGFDAGLIRWGEVDNELAVRLWLLGFELRVVAGVTVRHLFRDRHPYRVRWKEVIHNKLRLAFVHFGERRIAAVVDALSEHPAFPEGLALLATSNVSERRAALSSRRVHDDNWLFGRFGEWRREPIPLSPAWRVVTTTANTRCASA
jgi:GT2 family glycosyltransferase